MKTNQLFLIALVLGSTIFFSCKKNNTDPDPTPTVEVSKLLNMWNLEEAIETEKVNGQVIYTETTPFGANDYVHFYDSTHVASYVDGERDTITYTFTSSTSIDLDGEVFTLNGLTDNEVYLNTSESYTDSSGVVYEYNYDIYMTR